MMRPLENILLGNEKHQSLRMRNAFCTQNYSIDEPSVHTQVLFAIYISTANNLLMRVQKDNNLEKSPFLKRVFFLWNHFLSRIELNFSLLQKNED